MFLVQNTESENHHHSIAKAEHSSLDEGPSQRIICCLLDLVVDTVTGIIGCGRRCRPKCKRRCRPKCIIVCESDDSSDYYWWATIIWYIFATLYVLWHWIKNSIITIYNKIGEILISWNNWLRKDLYVTIQLRVYTI